MSTSGPHSRQKSCDACVRGKRRCGQESPACARCSRMGMCCTYRTLPSPPSQSLGYGPPNTLQSSNPIEDSETGSSDLFNSRSPLLFEDINEGEISFPSVSVEDVLRDISVQTMPQDRVDFCVRQFKSYPQSLLSRTRTPFIHPELFNDSVPIPQALQEAFCICSLYLSRTDATAAIIFRIIDAKCRQILETRTTWSISEHLAALQAFCLFQIIRLFDGDIRQRAIAEQQESILTDWTTDLLRRTQTSESPISPSWQNWIFSESVRRTIILSLMIQGIYSVAKRGYCCISDIVTSHSFTAQAALWEARSMYDWERASREMDHFDINMMDFSELLDRGKRSDIEDMGLLMMVTYLGVDRVREWAARSGSDLEISLPL